MEKYKYRPVKFFSLVFLFTWVFWFTAVVISRLDPNSNLLVLFMLLGLLVPSAVGLYMVFSSKSAALKKDYKEKLAGFYRIKPSVVAGAIGIFGLGIVVSILFSTFFGQSLNQFSLVGDASFSIAGVSTLLVFVLAAFFEELGWRGYAEDSIAYYHTWFTETLIFGLLWSLWHLPLFFIPDTYHYNILQLSPVFMVNFFVSAIPLDFLLTWVYVRNRRSISACMILHFVINFLQEQIAMTQVTKCVQTFVLLVFSAIIVLTNKDLFFGREHIGNILPGEDG